MKVKLTATRRRRKDDEDNDVFGSFKVLVIACLVVVFDSILDVTSTDLIRCRLCLGCTCSDA